MTHVPILLDVSRLIWRQWTRRLPTGIDRVCLAYLEHFAPRARAVVQFGRFRRILDREASNRLFGLLLEGSDQFRRRLVATLAAAAFREEDEVAGQLYLNVGHTGLNSRFLLPWLKDRGLRSVFLIHDLIPITHPQYCRDGEAERHHVRIENALRSASAVIVNSAATERDLARFAKAQGLPTPPCLVAWLGVDIPALPAAPAQSGLTRPHFVLIGTIEARKNHLLILRAWADLVARLGGDAPELIIIGQRGWKAHAAIDILDNPGSLTNHVRELTRCQDAALRQLLAGARALLMPSFAEGFGLPLIEALVNKTPVLATDLEVFREIAGDIPEYLEPNDQAGWAEAILAYTVDGPERQRQLNDMAGFRAPNWSDHFDKVEHFLEARSAGPVPVDFDAEYPTPV